MATVVEVNICCAIQNQRGLRAWAIKHYCYPVLVKRAFCCRSLWQQKNVYCNKVLPFCSRFLNATGHSPHCVRECTVRLKRSSFAQRTGLLFVLRSVVVVAITEFSVQVWLVGIIFFAFSIWVFRVTECRRSPSVDRALVVFAMCSVAAHWIVRQGPGDVVSKVICVRRCSCACSHSILFFTKQALYAVDSTRINHSGTKTRELCCSTRRRCRKLANLSGDFTVPRVKFLPRFC